MKKKVVKMFSQCVLWMIGWQVIGKFPDSPKYMVIIALHRKGSIEFLLSLLIKGITTVQPQRFMMKYELSKIPLLGKFLLWMGGVPVDRNRQFTKNQKGFHIHQAIDIINKSEKVAFVILPEGTRATDRNPRPIWKKGFYDILKETNIPLVCVAFDYQNKRVIISDQLVVNDFDYKNKIVEWYIDTCHYVPNLR